MLPSTFPLDPTVLRGAVAAWSAYQRWTWGFFAGLRDIEIPLVSPDGTPGGRGLLAEHVAATLAPDHQGAPRYAAGWRFTAQLPELVHDFDEPAVATPDALQRIPPGVLAPLLWLFIGGDGTGTRLHHDSLATHAWLAVLAGRKRFALHPPAAWHGDLRDRERDAECVLRGAGDREGWRYLEVERGDLILIPSGWWHAVVNDGPTIGLTRNVATPDIIPQVAAAARADGLTPLLPYLR